MAMRWYFSDIVKNKEVSDNELKINFIWEVTFDVLYLEGQWYIKGY